MNGDKRRRFILSRRMIDGASPEIERAGRDGGWLYVAGPDLQTPVWVRFGESDGRIVCTGVVIGPLQDEQAADDDHPGKLKVLEGGQAIVTATACRIPLAAIVSAAADDRAQWGAFARILGMSGRAPAPTTAPRTRPGKSGYPDEHYARIAREYRQALRKQPKAPTQLLIKHYAAQHFAAATVRRWVAIARARGFLGKARPGRAGEVRKAPRGRKKR